VILFDSVEKMADDLRYPVILAYLALV